MRSTKRRNTLVAAAALALGGYGLVWLHAQMWLLPADAQLPDGGRYQGETRDDRFHGEGRLVWPNGARYEGEFADGLMTGEGRYEFADGAVYEGDFVAGLFQGHGTFTTADGEVYRGRWVDDELREGVYRDGDGNRYTGEFRDWGFHGRGEYRTATGHVYRGSYRDGELHGEGVHIAPSGLRYEGMFRYGQYHGEGRVIREGEGEVLAGEWVRGSYQDGEGDGRERRAAVEGALYRQPALLDEALAGVAPGEPGEIELFFVGVAPYGDQDVFRREIDFVADQVAREFDAGGRSVVLGNHPDTLDERPMATRTAVERSLRHVAGRMNADEDILFVYLTSHGSEDHALAVTQPGMELPEMRARELGAWVDALPNRWTIVGISACYSGGFIPELRDADTLVMTAAREDRTSFGCGDDSDMTYFGRALFEDALPEASSFPAAFERARELVHKREKAAGIERHSEPRMALGDSLADHLERWREARGSR